MAASVSPISPSIPAAAASVSSPPPPSDGFDVLIHRLGLEKVQVLLEKLRTLDKKQETIGKILILAEKRNYSEFSDLFLDPDFEYYALAAVQEQKLTPMQLGTLMFVRAGITDKVKIEDIEVVSLFNGEAPSPQAWEYIAATLQSKPGQFIMDKHELARFFDIMRRQLVSERSFVLIPDTRRSPESDNNISVRLNKCAYFNAFCGLEINGKKMRMIPSYGMVKAMLDATGSDDFTFKLLLGEASANDIRLSVLIDNAREMFIRCLKTSPTPEDADDFDSPALDFLFHEIYHLFVCRHVPKPVRKFFCELATIVDPARFSSRAAQRAAWELFIVLTDLDIGIYRPDNLGPHVEKCYVITYVLEVILPARKLLFPKPKIKFTAEEEAEYRRVSSELTERVRGLFAVWDLYKSDCRHFEEVLDFFNRLEPEIQRQLGKDYLVLKEFAELCRTFNIPASKFGPLNPAELRKISQLIQKDQTGVLTQIAVGLSLTQILATQ